jgi:hypothetical protein
MKRRTEITRGLRLRRLCVAAIARYAAHLQSSGGLARMRGRQPGPPAGLSLNPSSIVGTLTFVGHSGPARSVMVTVCTVGASGTVGVPEKGAS